MTTTTLTRNDIYQPVKGDWASLDGVEGQVTRTYKMAEEVRNLWWRVDEDSAEILFSFRRDGVWRMVGAPANSRGLQLH